jgi:alpha-tubulin suppressor-like RCC1 family protein
MVMCGARHTVVVSGNRGKIWAWGANESGQIGVSTFDSYYGTFLPMFSWTTRAYILQEDEDETGEGDEEDGDAEEYTEAGGSGLTWLSPQILESMSQISLIVCGRDYTLALIEESHVPIQFAKDGNDEALCYWLENNPKMRDLDQVALKAELNSITSCCTSIQS